VIVFLEKRVISSNSYEQDLGRCPGHSNVQTGTLKAKGYVENLKTDNNEYFSITPPISTSTTNSRSIDRYN
jgi:hypothetical protein